MSTFGHFRWKQLLHFFGASSRHPLFSPIEPVQFYSNTNRQAIILCINCFYDLFWFSCFYILFWFSCRGVRNLCWRTFGNKPNCTPNKLYKEKQAYTFVKQASSQSKHDLILLLCFGFEDFMFYVSLIALNISLGINLITLISATSR